MCEALGLELAASGDREAIDQLAERLTRPVVLVCDAVERAELIAMAAPAAAVVALVDR